MNSASDVALRGRPRYQTLLYASFANHALLDVVQNSVGHTSNWKRRLLLVMSAIRMVGMSESIMLNDV